MHAYLRQVLFEVFRQSGAKIGGTGHDSLITRRWAGLIATMSVSARTLVAWLSSLSGFVGRDARFKPIEVFSILDGNVGIFDDSHEDVLHD